eukprot:TRINITY_DN14327_c0_g1_i1.p1 TRINITY_DN14327_c0_g1~~TRINITY_DN14327_c0_g1_i1.p1  ORF type:complete len:496 (+),score=40.72 TRINITY_DN14327_c0_g1_i1:64-1488(+)
MALEGPASTMSMLGGRACSSSVGTRPSTRRSCNMLAASVSIAAVPFFLRLSNIVCAVLTPVPDPACLTRQISSTRDVKELLGCLKGYELNEVHASAAWHKLVGLSRGNSLPKKLCSGSAMEHLLSQTQHLLEEREMGGQSVATAFRSVAKLHSSIPNTRQLFPGLVSASQRTLGEMTPQGLANLVWATAALHKKAPQLLDALPELVDAIDWRSADMIEQELCSILWAAAKLSSKTPEVSARMVAQVAPQVVTRADRLTGMEVANVLWALSKFQLQDADKLQYLPPLFAQATNKAKSMKPQELANTMWAIGLLGLRSPEADAALEACQDAALGALSHERGFTGQGLSNACWGLSMYGGDVINAELLHEVVKVVLARRAQWTGRNAAFSLPMIVCALVKLKKSDAQLLTLVAELLTPALRDLNDWGLCALAWSYSNADDSSADAPAISSFRAELDAQLQHRQIPQERVDLSPQGPG